MKNKILYQIENGKSSRRLIYENFDKFKWSEGNGEDGTFFTEDQLDFIIKNANINWYGNNGDHLLIKYEIDTFAGWPISDRKEKETFLNKKDLEPALI